MIHNGARFEAVELSWPMYVSALRGLELPMDVTAQCFGLGAEFSAEPAGALAERLGCTPGNAPGQRDAQIRLLLHALAVEQRVLKQAGAKKEAKQVEQRIATVERRLAAAVPVETQLIKATSVEEVEAHWERQRTFVLGAELQAEERLRDEHARIRQAREAELQTLRDAARACRRQIGRQAQELLGYSLAHHREQQQRVLSAMRDERAEAVRRETSHMRAEQTLAHQQHSQQKHLTDEMAKMQHTLGWRERGQADALRRELDSVQQQLERGQAGFQVTRETMRLGKQQQRCVDDDLAAEQRQQWRAREKVGNEAARLELDAKLDADAASTRLEKAEGKLHSLLTQQEKQLSEQGLRLRTQRERLQNLALSDVHRLEEAGFVMMRDLEREKLATIERVADPRRKVAKKGRQ
jgi:hypothetical protein